MRKFYFLSFLLLIASLMIAGCNDGSDGDTVENNFAGAVYAMDNASPTNSVTAYGRNSDGTLTLIGSTNTEGSGTGPNNVASGPGANEIDPLASNYALIMSEDNRFVFAVNAGSDEVSSFKVNDDYSLSHVSTIGSGGTDPVSLATAGNWVYVANSNQGVGSLAGFSFDSAGRLSVLNNSTRSTTGRPTAIRFTRDNQYLVVTEINTQRLHTFALDDGGSLAAVPETFEYETPASGRNVPNPFGLDTFSRDGNQYVAVGEARVFTGAGEIAPQTSSVSTFSVGDNGVLSIVSLDVRADNDGDDSTGPITTCWVGANDSGRQLFTSNTNSNSISSFDTNANGTTNLNTSEAFLQSGDFMDSGLTDLVVLGNYLYQLYAATGSVVTFRISNGALTEIDQDTDLSAIGGNQGIVGF